MRFLILITLLLLPVSTYADDYKSLIRFVIAKQNAGASLENQTQEVQTPESETAPASSTQEQVPKQVLKQKQCSTGSCTYRAQRLRLFGRWK